MTEHEKSSAVVEETRETVDTTPQPETTEKTAEKKNGSNKTSLALSAIAIAIALAAGVGLYGLVKQQALTRRPPAIRWSISYLPAKSAGNAENRAGSGD